MTLTDLGSKELRMTVQTGALGDVANNAGAIAAGQAAIGRAENDRERSASYALVSDRPDTAIVTVMNGVPVVAPTLPGGGHRDPCFADGAFVETPSGTVSIAMVSEGDVIATASGPSVVTWIGRVRVDIASQRRRDEMHLVRIRAGALADGMPTHDLLVMQDHLIMLNGAAIPAAMLVNGVSVQIDRTIGAYISHHMTLHGLPNLNAPTHGERDLGEQVPGACDHDTSMHDQPARSAHAHAIIATLPTDLANIPLHGRAQKLSITQPENASAPLVAPIYQEVARRAGAASAIGGLTPDAGLHLLTDKGDAIKPMTVRGGVARFVVPPTVTSVRLKSHTARPSDASGPFVDDRRSLGVLVGSISIHSDIQNIEISTHLHDAALDGWDGLEEAPMRWTTGDALVALGTPLNGAVRMLAVEIIASSTFGSRAHGTAA